MQIALVTINLFAAEYFSFIVLKTAAAYQQKTVNR
jgi:hypothetical protein